MRIKQGRILVMAGIGCLVLSVFAGCGHEQKVGERYEIQSSMEETGGSGNEISGVEYGKAEEAEGETINESSGITGGTSVIEYQTGETSSIIYFDNDPEESQDQGEFAGDEQEKGHEEYKECEVIQPQKEEESMKEESETVPETEKAPEPYYLSADDRAQVIARLVEMGERYGMKYYPDVVEGETWDSPTPIYAEELLMGRDHVMNAMVEYTEGAFVLMQMEGCSGFALQIKEYPNTVTGAYYEVYVYWM